MEYTMELRKFVAPEIITGKDARLMTGRYLLHFSSSRPMIVTDKNLISMPWFQDVIEEIERYVSEYVIFDEVTSNPKDYEVMAGAELFLSRKCDLLIAIGGGSPIDCAKGISIVSTNGGHILDYEGVDEITLPGPPLICIPTTSGASADVSQFAIIHDAEEKVKRAIISKKIVPDLALIDPVPLMTMDLYLTACTGMDALTHAIEAYVSNANSHLSDVHAIEAISLITRYISQACAPDRTISSLYQMMLGSLDAGLAFSNASLGLVHAMAHSMGGLLDLPHGECNSILLEHVISLNYHSAPKRYEKIAATMGLQTKGCTAEEICGLLIAKIRQLRESLFIQALEEVELLNEDILDMLSENSLNDPCILTNPKTVTKEEIFTIFSKTLRQK